MYARPPGGVTCQVIKEGIYFFSGPTFREYQRKLTPWSTYLKQELPQGHKGRPVVRFLSPALQHDVVNVLRTVFGLREAFPFFINLVQNLS